ncbi:MAG: hypothetical protein H2069_06010 [Legionella sp.]|nr:hypothetical protein [Legionella sp.]
MSTSYQEPRPLFGFLKPVVNDEMSTVQFIGFDTSLENALMAFIEITGIEIDNVREVMKGKIAAGDSTCKYEGIDNSEEGISFSIPRGVYCDVSNDFKLLIKKEPKDKLPVNGNSFDFSQRVNQAEKNNSIHLVTTKDSEESSKGQNNPCVVFALKKEPEVFNQMQMYKDTANILSFFQSFSSMSQNTVLNNNHSPSLDDTPSSEDQYDEKLLEELENGNKKNKR